MPHGITDGYGNGYIDVVTDDYRPPYQPRKQHFASMAAHVPQTWALTLSASIGPTDLPLHQRRIELDILWAPPKGFWAYVPLARFIPSWKLRLAGARTGQANAKAVEPANAKNSDEDGDRTVAVVDDRAGFGRELARAIISRLPLLCRLSTWV